jgi:hypothetical protein
MDSKKRIYLKIMDTRIDEIRAVVDEKEMLEHILNKGDEFALLYESVLHNLNGLSKTDIKVYLYCVIYCKRNTNVIALYEPMVKEIAALFQTTPNYVRQTISRLNSFKMIIKITNAVYRVNIGFSWKGNGYQRKKVVDYLKGIDYNSENEE